jgi:hypothetical protein
MLALESARTAVLAAAITSLVIIRCLLGGYFGRLGYYLTVQGVHEL